MKIIMVILVQLITYIYSNQIYAYDNDIWLEDTNCKIMGANNTDISVKNGTLATSICAQENTEVVCSISTKNGTMYGNKPSNVVKYKIVTDDGRTMVWVSDCNWLVLDIKNKRYYYAGTFLVESGLLSKSCVGKIK